jgi:hypothetical protein
MRAKAFTKASENYPQDEMRRINNIEGEKGEGRERERGCRLLDYIILYVICLYISIHNFL